MNKSEKSFYVIIKNKKCGKFSGAGPIQVTKKVASKKLKAGKEIEFYLDEVGGKKKRYGPYHGRKDKKTGQVVVVNGRKVMKGGLLSANDISKLRLFFYSYNDSLILPGNKVKNESDSVKLKLPNFVKLKLPLIPFFNEPIIFFDPSVPTKYVGNYYYKYAVFKESNGCIYIIIYNTNPYLFKIISFTEFFLNPLYSKNIENSRHLLEELKNPENINSRTIREEAIKIFDFLYISINTNNLKKQKQKVIIYIPNYSQQQIKKCVYPDLTYGILDEETPTRILSNLSKFPKPTSFFQKFLILKKTGLSGMSVNEPVIYVRNPFVINANEVEELKQKIISEKKYNSEILQDKNSNGKNLMQFERELQSKLELLNFDYCIYYTSNDNKLIIIQSNGKIVIDYFKIHPIIFYILFTIPFEFGRFQRIREVSNSILQYHIPKNSKQIKLEKQIKQLQQIIESLKLPESKNQLKLNQIQSLIKNLQPQLQQVVQPQLQQVVQPQLQQVVQQPQQIIESLKLPESKNQLKSQLNQIQSLIKNLQPQLQLQQVVQQPQQNLEQQLTLLQKLLIDKLIESKNVSKTVQDFLNNSMPIPSLNYSTSI